MRDRHVCNVTHMTPRYETPEQLVATPRLTGLSGHRNGPVIALRQELSSDGKRYVKHAWSVPRPTDGDRAPVPLTSGDHGVQEVCPAPSGELYFTSDRPMDGDHEKRSRLWLLPERGDARMVLDMPEGISDPKLGGDMLFFLSGMHPSAKGAADELARNRELHELREESGASPMLYDRAPFRYWDHDLPAAETALWFVDTAALAESRDAGEAVRRVDLPAGRLTRYSVAPDGTWLIAQLTAWLPEGWERSQLWRVPITADGAGQAELFRDATEEDWWEPGPVSPDGSRVVLERDVVWRDGVNLQISLWVHDLRTGRDTEVVPTDEYWAGESRWIDDDSFVCTSDYQGRGIVLRATCPRGGDSSIDVLAGGAEQPWTYCAVHPVGDAFYGLRATYDHPLEVVTWSGREFCAEPTRIDGLVPDDAVPGRLEEVTTTAEDGTSIRAWLALPEGEGTEHPLLVFVHGGPWASNNQWSWRWNPWPFVARGYAVLFPDPAISTGYGQAMIDRGQQELGGAPFTDVMALVEATTQRADIDAQRQALLGGSYGGYMANWVATQTADRFRCIVTHASLWNLDSMGATTDNTEWREAMGPAQAAVYSPHRFVDRIQVPMLVIHGDKDYRVPISQGIELWSDLQLRTRVEGHRFLYFPDENHWILKPANSRAWYETVLAFLAEHVLGEEWQRPELLG